MRKVKVYKYFIDNGFVKGQVCAYNEKGARRHLRKLLGLSLYFKVHKLITIQEIMG